MNKKEFKLLIENFNRFLLKEHQGHTQKCTDLFAAIPAEFQPYINDNMHWYNGDAWMSGVEHDSLEEEEDQKLLFEGVAKACGCNVEDLLVHFVDNFVDDLYMDQNIDEDDFLDSYKSNGTLCGSFDINGSSLKGFYFSYGTDSAQFGLEYSDGTSWPRSMMSERTLKGLMFVAPSVSSSTSSSTQKRKFKANLGSAW